VSDAPIGILLAAGEGRRLRPLTLVRPKPLVPVLGLPVLEIALRQLEALGCRLVAVNGHQLSARLATWLATRARSRPQLEIRFFDEPRLLGTGGGLRRMLRELPPGPVLVQNGDVIHDIDLAALYQAWQQTGADIGLLAAGQPAALHLDGECVVGFGTGPRARLGFGCVHLLSQPGRRQFVGLSDADLIADYRRLLAAGRPIAALLPPGPLAADLPAAGAECGGGGIRAAAAPAKPLWLDMGSLARYLALHRELAGDGRFRALLDRLGLEPRWCEASGCSLGEGSHLPAEARDCVAWDGVDWRGTARSSLLLDGVRGQGRLDGEIVL
jgi:mannose-1-phosphate guanylyltransferase